MKSASITNASRLAGLGSGLFAAAMTSAWAEDAPPVSPPPTVAATPGTTEYKKLTLEELMNLEVTSVSRRPEKLSETASAIQVVTGDDIRRSGATSIPEALRLAPNLQVAQVNASEWAISARGFDNVLANKLLVMIDGRTVYTPLYAGVYWDVQNVLLEDVDRIEVVSGPGGALWGANAVNGVINILTKSAKDTQGTYASASYGTEMQDFAAIRSGGQLAPDLYIRVYGERSDRNDTQLLDGQDAGDRWGITQGGFRMDWEPGVDHATLQGDAYEGKSNPPGTGTTPATIRGGNALGRWTHTISPESDVQLQLYYDWTWRDANNGFTENVQTYDVDWQHRFRLGGAQEVVWGLGYRLVDDTEQNLPLLGFQPAHQNLHLYSAFVQDEITVIKDRLRVILGSKFEHNDYTGLEPQPSGRLAWTPDDHDTIWAAVSRAVRTPSRLDRDFALLAFPGFPVLQGGADFQSEKVIAYELGWRLQPLEQLSLSLATFYNRYDDIRSAQPGPPPFGFPITLANGVEGETYGAELGADCRLSEQWRLRGGYTFLKKHLRVKAGEQDLNNASAESNDPEHQALVQSSLDLPGDIQFDAVVRYVAALPNPHVPSYFGLDLRLAVKATEHLELSVVGQNLLDSPHQEFVPASPSPRQIERSVYANATLRW